MDVDDEEDPVPEITKRHFEEAMKFARRFGILRVNTVLSLCENWCCGAENISSGSTERQISISAQVSAPDIFIRYFKNYIFLT
jgi:hypothetical protein